MTDQPDNTEREGIEEALRTSAAKVRRRNERMGWPVVTEEWLRKHGEQAEQPSTRVAEDTPESPPSDS